MKRLLHNLSRLLVLLVVFNFAARPAAAENTSDEIKISSPTYEYWYSITFCNGGASLHPANGDMIKTAFSDNSEEFQWKFMTAPTVGFYYLVNRNGRYISYSKSSNRYRLSDSQADA